MREARTNTHKDYMNKNGEIDNIKKGILAGDGEEVKKTGVKAVENKVGYPFRTDKKLYATSGYKMDGLGPAVNYQGVPTVASLFI